MKNLSMIQEKLSEFYDGEASEAERLEIEAHLKSCRECTVFYENWKAIASRLFERRDPDHSEAFVQKLMERLEKMEKKSGWKLVPVQWFTPVIGVAAALLLFLTPSFEPVSTETVLMNGAFDGVSERAFADVSTKTDDVIGFITEES